ncbi:MAG: hypothetical protein EU540_04870 [Promethearchaeota archaeon]|nr:MAG: hypothetical protein EU540_04870 [Candidatus Lokiarchaeota archaeon]
MNKARNKLIRFIWTILIKRLKAKLAKIPHATISDILKNLLEPLLDWKKTNFKISKKEIPKIAIPTGERYLSRSTKKIRG